MKFAYEDLSDDQFETLVTLLCQHVLGIAVQGFSKGPDGGRDAKFVGTAELHPSKASPWKGTTVIQAKHTNGYNKNFAESDFFKAEGGENTVLGKEIPRIKKLRNANQLDHYMLFANRRLAGNAESTIRSHIASECGIAESSIYLCGVEQLELWLRNFPDVPANANLDPIDSPLIVSSNDLAEIVQALARHVKDPSNVVGDPPTTRVSYERKNDLNNMTDDYAKVQRRLYLKDTSQLRAFLANPENLDLLDLYQSVVDEFQLKIIAKRKDYQTFDEVMNYLVDMLYARDPILRQRQHKKLLRVVLFYMYWNCDIGKTDDVAAN